MLMAGVPYAVFSLGGQIDFEKSFFKKPNEK